MKKLIWTLPVVVLTAVLSVFSLYGQHQSKEPVTNMFFEYKLTNVPTTFDPSDYLDVSNWIYRSVTPSTCSIPGEATCFITINSTVLSGFSGTNESRLVQFLEQQGQSGSAFSDPVNAVEALRGVNTKEEK